jgi:peroxisomal membrane protein 4
MASSSSSTLSAIESFIKDPKYSEYLALVKGARNGLVYGARIRFPHALVMAILFGKGEYV